jgi:hypothetical protein
MLITPARGYRPLAGCLNQSWGGGRVTDARARFDRNEAGKLVELTSSNSQNEPFQSEPDRSDRARQKDKRQITQPPGDDQ